VPKLYLDKNLQIMFGVTLMVILGVSSIMPALPELMRELRVPARSIGLVITLFTLPGIFLAPIVGILADRAGRKRILVAALLIFGTFGTACAFTWNLESLLVFRFLQGIGVGSLSVLSVTIIGDLYEGEERISALGYATVILSVGSAVFPLIGGMLATIGWQYPFLLNIMALPLGLVVHLFLRNPEPSNSHGFKEYVKRTFSVIGTRRAIGLFAITFLSLVILYGPYITYVPVLLNERFQCSPVAIGIVVSVSSLFTGLTSSQVGRLATRFKVISILCFAFVLYVLSLSMIPLIHHLWLIVIPTALFGAAMGLNAPSRMSLLTGLSPIGQRAAVISVNGIFQRLGQTISPVLMGLLLVDYGLDAVFWAGAAVTLVMLAVAVWVVK
jgi:MFS family permease